VGSAQVWIPLLGVAVGGGLSYLAQFTAGRQAGRSEDKRQAAQLAEARRSERLELLREFIALAQEGIRIAERRKRAADPLATPAEWLEAARSLIDRLWVCERMIRVLFGDEFFQRAWDYASAVDHVIWEHQLSDEKMWDHLREHQTRFLNAARREVA